MPKNKKKYAVKHRPTGLIILDGWGYREPAEDNAISQANTPVFDALWNTCPHTLIHTSGHVVGLPDGQMGNSEVGHLNLGAGRTVYQELTRIGLSIQDGSFCHNPVLAEAADKAAEHGHIVHVLGLLSDGGVHSHIDHMKATVKMAISRGAKVRIHIFTDGRDVAPQSALQYLEELEAFIEPLKGVRISSVVGRYYAMDRDNRWERTKEAFDVIACGKGLYEAGSAKEAVEMAYERGETDEFIHATAIRNKKGKFTKIKEGDAIIFTNFRADRARQLTRAFIEKDFAEFARCANPELSAFVTMTEYNKNFTNAVRVAFPPQKLKNTFGEWISKLGLKQLRIAETEKYAHVTFFLNGGREAPFEGEDRILIPSPKVATYDLKPEMSVFELADQLCEAIRSGQYDTFVCNIANPDMVGHSGKLDACIKAVEAVDKALGQIMEALQEVNGEIIITADHGNIEQLKDPATGQALTSHTTSPVPFIYYGHKPCRLREDGGLPDVMPTLLDVMDLPIPDEMTGKSLCELKA